MDNKKPNINKVSPLFYDDAAFRGKMETMKQKYGTASRSVVPSFTNIATALPPETTASLSVVPSFAKIATALPPRTTASRSVVPKKEVIVVYLVLGMGSKQYETENQEYFVTIIQKFCSWILPQNIKVRCPSTLLATKDVAKTFCHLPPTQNNIFVTSLYEEIHNDIQMSNQVFIFGFSYGGAVANRLAERVQESNWTEAFLSKLKIATFASIYFAQQDHVSAVNIVNYISIGDVAFRCNKYPNRKWEELTYSVFQNNNIFCRIQPPSENNYIIQLCLYEINEKNENVPICLHRPSITNWKEHQSYLPLLIFLLEMKTNLIFEYKTKRITIVENTKINAGGTRKRLVKRRKRKTKKRSRFLR